LQPFDLDCQIGKSMLTDLLFEITGGQGNWTQHPKPRLRASCRVIPEAQLEAGELPVDSISLNKVIYPTILGLLQVGNQTMRLSLLGNFLFSEFSMVRLTHWR
jgi:hypothetical protein